MADIMISTMDLTKVYNGRTVVNNVNMQIERGGIIALVGQNGAGKTTLIRMLTGLVRPTSGSYQLLPQQKRSTCDVAAIVERPSIYSNLSAMDNLVAQSNLLDIPKDTAYLESTLRLVGLDPAMKKIAKNFSLGMKQRLAIAMTLVGKPQLLILDEPTNGLDPQGIVDMREIFVNLNKELGVTILISSHILSELGKFATDFYIMDRGVLVKRVSRDELEDMTGNRMCLTVDNVELTVNTLKDLGVIEGISDNKVSLRTELPITQIMLTLAQAGVSVQNLDQTGDALEDYYLQVIRNFQCGGIS